MGSTDERLQPGLVVINGTVRGGLGLVHSVNGHWHANLSYSSWPRLGACNSVVSPCCGMERNVFKDEGMDLELNLWLLSTYLETGIVNHTQYLCSSKCWSRFAETFSYLDPLFWIFHPWVSCVCRISRTCSPVNLISSYKGFSYFSMLTVGIDTWG